MTEKVKVPTVGESIEEVTISAWRKANSEYVEMDEIIAELESDKATFELTAPCAGELKILKQSGDTVPVGETVCEIDTTVKPKPRKKETKIDSTAPSVSPADSVSHSQDVPTPISSLEKESYAKGHPSPAARKILDEKHTSPSQVTGTGVGGRITKEDALHVQPEQKLAFDSLSSARIANGREERREKISSLRKTIARRLVSVKNETAMLTTFNEVDMKSIMDLRILYKEKFKDKYGVGLGFMSFFTKTVCVALKEFPALNAYIDGSEFVYHNYCDISIAVSTPRGLVVPVIRNAELLQMHEIESEVARLATRGREGKLSIEEMTGGTFSITNGGVFGSMLSTPILNPPQSAILGIHNIVQRPVVVNQEVVVRPIMYLALSYDHRIVDGKESVSFLVKVKEMLEEPSRLILGV